MIDSIVKLAIEVGIVIIAAWAANKLTKQLTGRSIPDHLSGWYEKLVGEISTWANNHKELKISKVILESLIIIDKLVIAMRKTVKIYFKAQTQDKKELLITERELTPEEALKLFPELGTSKLVILATNT